MNCDVCKEEKITHTFVHKDKTEEEVCDKCYQLLYENLVEMKVIKKLVKIKAKNR